MPIEPPVDLGEWVKDGPSLGDGGQAVVYRVHKNADPGRTPFVAKVLKVWDTQSKSASEVDQRGRFKREILALESLASTGCPNIVPVIDKQVDPAPGAQPWYVMPFYGGGPMARTDSETNVTMYAEPYRGSVDRVLQIAESVAATLAWMHESEPTYVHRDVHTGNIFFDQRGGTPILGDFGLVHFHGGSTVRTGGREPLGPWHWRPPEFHPGSPDKANPKSDVYLLGGVIYEALSGGVFIEETQQVGGRFTHELPEYNLSQFSEDVRIKYVTSLLGNMLARDSRARITAQQVVEACRVIREWKPSSEPLPVPSSLKLEQAAAKYRESGHAYRTAVTMQHLFLRCGAIAKPIRILDQRKPYSFHRQLSLTSTDSSPTTAVAARYPGGVWAAITATVVYEPRPPILLRSYVMLIRTEENKEIVALFNEQARLTVLSESVPDDPRHDELVSKTTLAEVERLAEKAASLLEATLAQEPVDAEFRKVRIQDVTCAFVTHRLLRHLVQASNTNVMGWVESDDAMRTLGMSPDDFRSAASEAETGLGFAETQKAMVPTGFARVRLRPEAFVRLLPKVLPDVDLEAEGMRLLKRIGAAGLDSRVSADDIERDCEVPIPRAAVLLEFFKPNQLLDYGGPPRSAESLPFRWASILPRGARVMEGFESLPL